MRYCSSNRLTNWLGGHTHPLGNRQATRTRVTAALNYAVVIASLSVNLPISGDTPCGSV